MHVTVSYVQLSWCCFLGQASLVKKKKKKEILNLIGANCLNEG